MKKSVLFIPLLFFISTCLSQESSDSLSVEKFLFKIKGYPTGIEAEIGLNKNATFVANVEAFYFINTDDDNDDNSFAITPVLDLQYRYFFNLEKRLKKGKNTANNSGNFFGLKSVTYFPVEDSDTDFFNTTGPVWGLQRNYADHWNMALELGLGLAISNDYTGTYVFAPFPIISFNIGYNF